MVLDPLWIKLWKGQRVEGALTSGAGFGAICRPLTDWPLMEARLRRLVEPPFASLCEVAGPCTNCGPGAQAPKAPQPGREWPQALDFRFEQRNRSPA